MAPGGALRGNQPAISRRRQWFCAAAGKSWAAGVKNGPGKPISISVSVSCGGLPGRHHPMTGPSAHPAEPPVPPTQAGLAPGARAGVPVSIWPAVPTPARCPAGGDPVPCTQRLGVQAGLRVVTAFSRPGVLVVIPGPGTGTLAVAAAAAGRRVLALAASPGQRRALAQRLGRDLPRACRPLARLRPGGPAGLLQAASPYAGQAGLAVITACATPGCPPPDPGSGTPATAGAAAQPGPGELYVACQRVLAPGGVLVVITNAARQPGHPGELIAAARAAGFTYTQHIIAVHASIRASRLTPGPTSPPSTGPQPGAARHLPAHTDLLVFTEGGPRP